MQFTDAWKLGKLTFFPPNTNTYLDGLEKGKSLKEIEFIALCWFYFLVTYMLLNFKTYLYLKSHL